MNTQKTIENTKEEIKVSIRLKLSTLWTSFMFLYIYVDYFALYMPNKIKDISTGKIFVFNITQEFLLTALVSVTIPAMMIFLSVLLKTKVCRWTNIIIASVYIPYSLFNLAGETWMHMFFGAIIEVIVLSVIIWHAWKWPQTN